MEKWNITVYVDQLKPITVDVFKDCYTTELYEEVSRRTAIGQANIRLAFQGTQLSNNPQERKRLSDYRITNNAQLSAHVNRPAPPTAAETWIINVKPSGERTASVVVTKDCLTSELFKEINKQVYGAENTTVRLFFQDREVLSDAHKRLSDYGITNNAHLIMSTCMDGG